MTILNNPTPDTSKNDDVRNIPIEAIREVARHYETADKSKLVDRVAAWNEVIGSISPQAAERVAGSSLADRTTNCQEHYALVNHMTLVDFGFNVALELFRQGKLDKQASQQYGVHQLKKVA